MASSTPSLAAEATGTAHISEECIETAHRYFGYLIEPYDRGSLEYNPGHRHPIPDVDQVGRASSPRSTKSPNPCPCDLDCEHREMCAKHQTVCPQFVAWCGRGRGQMGRTPEEIAALPRTPDRSLHNFRTPYTARTKTTFKTNTRTCEICSTPLAGMSPCARVCKSPECRRTRQQGYRKKSGV